MEAGRLGTQFFKENQVQAQKIQSYVVQRKSVKMMPGVMTKGLIYVLQVVYLHVTVNISKKYGLETVKLSSL